MLIIPAIDLQAGVCVRLLQGRFDVTTDYGDPSVQLRRFADAGAEWVHIVDLDGARLGRPAQQELVARLVNGSGLKVQCGGGVRQREHVETLLASGVARVVVGSMAVRRPDVVRLWADAFGAEQLCIAMDVRAAGSAWEVALEGWAEAGGRTLDEILQEFPPGSIAHVLVTDIARDGALTGPNLELLQAICAARPDLRLQASGGIARIEDVVALRELGVDAAIVGRALYEHRFTLEDALAQ